MQFFFHTSVLGRVIHLLLTNHLELILGDFAPALLEVSFGMILHNRLETNHPKKCLAKH